MTHENTFYYYFYYLTHLEVKNKSISNNDSHFFGEFSVHQLLQILYNIDYSKSVY